MANIKQNMRAAIPKLLTGRTVSEACENAGVPVRTYYAWLKNERFVRELTEAQNQLVQDGYDALRRGIEKAASKLVTLVDHDDPRIALRAATNVLQLYSQQTELAQLFDQIEGLKARLDRAGI